MEQYDVLIVGAATSGSFFARRIAEAGHSVLVIDRLERAQLGRRLDVFRIGESDLKRFGLPLPEQDDDFAFACTGGVVCSAFGRHPKPMAGATVGMHMPRYVARMNRWAAEAGAKFSYGASFVDFLYENGRVAGASIERDGRTEPVRAKLVADCSGIPSVARTKLPDGYGAENFIISDAEKSFVTLRCAAYHDPRDYVKGIRAWPFYQTWEAPDANPTGAILGVRAQFSYEAGEKAFAALEKAVSLPRYTVKRIERGTTPCRRPPYSFVADGFLASGDAACLTKPSSGEGVAASMVQLEIAADVVGRLLDEGGYLTRARLWPINKRYVEAQGKAFAAQLAAIRGAMSMSAAEDDFLFMKDVMFSETFFQSFGSGGPSRFPFGERMSMALRMHGGVFCGKLRVSTLRSLFGGMHGGERIRKLYAAYPPEENGFDEWTRRADALWKACGGMADRTGL